MHIFKKLHILFNYLKRHDLYKLYIYTCFTFFCLRKYPLLFTNHMYKKNLDHLERETIKTWRPNKLHFQTILNPGEKERREDFNYN